MGLDRNIWADHQKFSVANVMYCFFRRVPCAGVEAEFALFSGNHPPVGSRNRIGIESESWAPSQYPKRRLSVRSREVSKPRDWYFKLSYRFEIWQAHRQQCCQSACQIAERSDNSKFKSRGFETLRDLTERRLFGYWDGVLAPFQYLIRRLTVRSREVSRPRDW